MFIIYLITLNFGSSVNYLLHTHSTGVQGLSRSLRRNRFHARPNHNRVGTSTVAGRSPLPGRTDAGEMRGQYIADPLAKR